MQTWAGASTATSATSAGSERGPVRARRRVGPPHGERFGGRYAAIAGLVARGEWTTYGDISIAIHGSPRYARHVGRAAASLDGFPNALRVLASGGVIAAGWRGHDGEGPDACRTRLEGEGVRFRAGRADPARYRPWEELLRRADTAGIARTPTIAFS